MRCGLSRLAWREKIALEKVREKAGAPERRPRGTVLKAPPTQERNPKELPFCGRQIGPAVK